MRKVSIKKISFVILMGISMLITGLIIQDKLYDPLNKETIIDLFGNENSILNRVNKHDFIGFSFKGEFFEYYEYNLDSEIIKDLILSGKIYKLPAYQNGFYLNKEEDLQGSLVNWTKTPSENKEFIEYYNLTFGSGNALDYSNSKYFFEKNYINHGGNFFSYCTRFPIGIHVYVLVPSVSKLFLIIKKI